MVSEAAAQAFEELNWVYIASLHPISTTLISVLLLLLLLLYMRRTPGAAGATDCHLWHMRVVGWNKLRKKHWQRRMSMILNRRPLAWKRILQQHCF